MNIQNRYIANTKVIVYNKNIYKRDMLWGNPRLTKILRYEIKLSKPERSQGATEGWTGYFLRSAAPSPSIRLAPFAFWSLTDLFNWKLPRFILDGFSHIAIDARRIFLLFVFMFVLTISSFFANLTDSFYKYYGYDLSQVDGHRWLKLSMCEMITRLVLCQIILSR